MFYLGVGAGWLLGGERRRKEAEEAGVLAAGQKRSRTQKKVLGVSAVY